MPRVEDDMVGLLGTVMSEPRIVRSYLRGKWGRGMALLKAGRFKKQNLLSKAGMGEVGRN